MLITSHLLATLALGKILSIEFPELYFALFSGVAIDADHFFVNGKWIQDIRGFLKERKITYGTKQHSWMQEFAFGLFAGTIIGLLVFYFWPAVRWWIFPLFLFLHIVLDSVMTFKHEPFAPFFGFEYFGWLRSGTKKELVFSLIGLAVLFLFF